MTALDETPTSQPGPASPVQDSSRFWRSIWRTHFYAGIFAMPILVLLAVTGLGILYTDIINDWQYGNLRTVAVGAERVSLDDQRDAAVQQYADWNLDSVTPPKGPRHRRRSP